MSLRNLRIGYIHSAHFAPITQLFFAKLRISGIYSPMTPAEIKTWLRSHNKDRDWLSRQCGVSKRTIDGWLNAKNPRTIPEPSQRILDTIMKPHPVVIHPTLKLSTFEKLQQMAEASHVTVSEMIAEIIEDRLAENARLKAAEDPGQYHSAPRPPEGEGES